MSPEDSKIIRVSVLTVTRSGDTLTASWDAPDGAAKYHVTYSDDDGLNRAAVGPDDNYSETSIDITDIDAAKTYTVGVRAGNQYGWSSWRNSAPNSPDAPPRPGTITVSRADGTLTASWDAVNGAAKYHVTYSSTGGESWNLAAPNHTETSITINVDNQKTYVVAVRAGNAGGWSNWRNSASSAPHTPPPPPPAAPAQITTERICDHYFRARWDPSPGATGYDLNISNNNRKTWKRALTDEPYNVWEFTKWSKNKTYWLAVRARNAGGESGWTNAAAAPPPTCEPDSLRVVTQTTQGQTGGSLTATWDAAKRAAAYHVNYSANGAHSWQRVADNQSATTYTQTVASPGNDVIAVQSVNGGGDLLSQWRNARAAWLTASDVAAGGATLTLTGHSGDWYVKKTSPAPAGTCSAAISGNTHDLTGLDGGTAQTVTAYGDAGCVNAIASTTFTTLNPTLTVSDVTGSGATLNLADYSRSWYVKKTAPTPAGTCSSAITGATHDLTGLTGGTNYYTYTAYSDSGCATALHSVTFATPVTVSNFGEAIYQYPSIASGDRRSAVGFTTGSAVGGYTLSEITARFANKLDPNNALGDIAVTLHAKTPNSVGDNLAPASAALATLSGVNPDTAGDYTYTCAGSGCALAPSTTYFVQFTATAGTQTDESYNWSGTESNDQTTVPSGNGWTLADGTDYFSAGAYNIQLPDTAYLKVVATVNPSLVASGITATGATLTLSGYDVAWWYKGSQSDAACQSAGTAATASLANLPTGASYTYTAYSDSSCATALASVTFSTRLTVGNLSETTHASFSNEVGYKHSNVNWRWANAFTTGSAVGGYTLHGVTFAFGATTGSPTRVHAKIYADASGLPGTLVKNLGSKNPTGAGNQTWNCTGAGCTLSPDTTYHVALEADATGTAAGHYYDWNVTASTNQTNVPAGAGWTLADYGSYKENQGAWTAFGDEAGKFALSATALPGLVASSIAATTATLRLSDYSGAWWLKRAGGACESAGTTATKTVTSLTANQSYTYKAYSKSGCDSADEIASVTFTTSRLAAASVTATTATLTIADHTGNWYVKRTAPAPAGTCSRTIRGATHFLDNLESGTTYTYKAYSQSGCASANEIATLTFTTSSLAATPFSTSKIGLTLSDYHGAWWYKGNQSGATCTSVTAGTTTATVTDLTRGQSYTYTAYSKANCNSADAIDSVTFTTTSLSVSNLIETKAGVFKVAYILEAIGFTTGDNSTGYRLWSVTARFDAASGAHGDIIVAIYAESGGNPAATATYTLSGSNPVTAGNHTFTCSGGCTLDAKTTYYLVITGTSTQYSFGYFNLHYTSSTHQTNTPIYAGWSIADAGKYYYNGSWEDNSAGRGLQFELAASPNPNLAASGVTATTATLTLSNHDGAWWYEGSQSGAACTAVAAGTASASLASLTAGTSYTYNAYSKANCNSADELAAATFTTLAAFNANPVAATTATLNLTGHTGSWYVKETAPATNASCSTAITGTTHDLTGLTEGTNYYTYTAYSDSGCATALHSVTFATPLTVSNLGEAAYTASSYASGGSRSAVGFTTGSAAGGYTLGAITARFKAKRDPNNALGDIVVTLHAAGANTTGDKLAPAVASLARLSGANPATAGDHTYTCAGAGCALAPDTTYFVQFTATAGNANTETYLWSGTLSDNQTTAPSGNGWTLADETDFGRQRQELQLCVPGYRLPQGVRHREPRPRRVRRHHHHRHAHAVRL